MKTTTGGIRSIPIELICPKCERGRLIKSTMPKRTARLGNHYRPAYCRCDRCDYTGTRYFKCVGVEE